MKNQKKDSLESTSSTERTTSSSFDEEAPALPLHPLPTAPTEDEADNFNGNENSDNEDDARARQEARVHRQNAQNMVRDHLQNHVRHNPGASSDYVTWIATLHPENAEIQIDTRFFVPGNAWWTIYEEIKNNPDVPLVQAVPVSDSDEETGAAAAAATPSKDDSSKGTSSLSKDSVDETNNSPSPHCCCIANPIALLCGFLFLVPSLVGVLTVELVACCCCHFPATIFYKFSEALAPPNCCTCLLYLITRICFCAFSLADSFALLASICVAECLGVFAIMVGFLTGGCLWAKTLHQIIRRGCHGIRVVFRKHCSSQGVPRGFKCHAKEMDVKPHMRGVTVVNVRRVRNPSESIH